MNGPVRLVLRVEFTAAAEPVEGVVLAAGQSAQAFSGWSELFAVLMAATSWAGGDAIAADRDQRPAPEQAAAAQSEERRNDL